MSKPSFVYVTYIATTIERLYRALTSAEFTERYMFGRRVESTWKVGAPVRYLGRDGKLSDSGEVLEADPPRRLVFTWRVEFDDALRRGQCTAVASVGRQMDRLSATDPPLAARGADRLPPARQKRRHERMLLRGLDGHARQRHRDREREMIALGVRRERAPIGRMGV